MLKIATFYRFMNIADPELSRSNIKSYCLHQGFKGSILIGAEGINGTISGPDKKINSFVSWIRQNEGISFSELKFSWHENHPFKRMTVKVKKEIVTIGVPGISPPEMAADYISPDELQNWYEKGEDFEIIDVRNTYEIKLGTFQSAIDPETGSFREFPEWVKDKFDKDKKIVTFCTGGIRCEKATAIMKKQGYNNVYQLKGGILQYLEEAKNKFDKTYFEGDCFVFDKRVAVDKELNKSQITYCATCISPLSEDDLKSELFIEDKQCPHCAGTLKNFHLMRVRKGLRRREKQLKEKQKNTQTLRQLQRYFKEAGR